MPNRAIERCRQIAAISEIPGQICRTFLCPCTYQVHALLREWMEAEGMEVWVDHAGNLHGLYPGAAPEAPRLLIGSHIDTVPNAGPFDGVLGVVLGIEIVAALQGRRLPSALEVIAFSEEEGVRFGVPFIGSRALIGTLDEILERTDAAGITLADALLPQPHAALAPESRAYFEIHIEQGPVLESLDLPLGVVTAIAGQSRYTLTFAGKANHAGTTPMHLRDDALTRAARWVLEVEAHARRTPGLVATVGTLEVRPGAGNIIPGEVRASLDVRHADDATREAAVAHLLAAAGNATIELRLDQPAVPCDPSLTAALGDAVSATGYTPYTLPSGAGHDAMIVAQRLPIAMLFLRSPGGLSHHPDETVLPEDVDAGLAASVRFLESIAG